MIRILFVSILVFISLRSFPAKVTFPEQDAKPQPNNKCDNDKDCPRDVDCYGFRCLPLGNEENKKCQAVMIHQCPPGHILCYDSVRCGKSCDAKNDCPDGEDEFNCEEPCECEDIYSFVYQCQEYSDEWIVIPRRYISGYVADSAKSVRILTKEMCKAICLNTPDCKSFEIISNNGLFCSLNTITPGNLVALGKNLSIAANYDLYTPKCKKCFNFYQ